MTKAYIRAPIITYTEIPDEFSCSLKEDEKGFTGSWIETIKGFLQSEKEKCISDLLTGFDSSQKYGYFSGGAIIQTSELKNGISVKVTGSRKDAILGILREILLQAKLVMDDDEIFGLVDSLEVKRDD